MPLLNQEQNATNYVHSALI